MTVACARCHDHKFDPITTRDYYGLAGVLASVRLTDRYLLPDDRVAAVSKARSQVAELEKRVAALKAEKKKDPKAIASTAAVDRLKAEMAAIKKATPDYDAPMAAGLEEASLHVLPDGPHRPPQPLRQHPLPQRGPRSGLLPRHRLHSRALSGADS